MAVEVATLAERTRIEFDDSPLVSMVGLMRLVWPSRPPPGPLAMFATLLYSTLLAGLLAMVSKGNSRFLVMSALLLLLASFDASVYF